MTPAICGRHSKIFDPPRDILKAIPGIKLKEMKRIREYSFCCGGGGGARTGKLEFAMATASRRVKEAEASGASYLATSCPFCAQNFLDFISTSGSKLELVDVVKLLSQSVFGETERKKRGGRDAE